MISTSPRSIVLLTALLICAATAEASPAPGADLMRIRLLEQLHPSQVVVSSAMGMSVEAEDGTELFSIPPSTDVSLTVHRGEVRIEATGRAVVSGTVRLSPLAPSALVLRTGRQTVRRYEGTINVSVDSGSILKLINHVPLEAYVASVVASEYGLDDIEGSKAMAVIARTYALKALNSQDDSYDHVDHTLSQVYKGADAVTNRAREAAKMTEGQVVTYNGELIEAVYYSSSGGHTADNETVWNSSAHPYLRGKSDPWDRISPHHSWEFELTERQVRDLVEDAYGLDLDYLEVAERSGDGRAATVRLVTENGRNRTLSANELRLEFIRAFGARSLRSTLFDVRRKRGTYRFEGHGFGHGVGLSQWGAHAMAQAGHSYEDILTFYYTGVELDGKPTWATEAPAIAQADQSILVVPDAPVRQVDNSRPVDAVAADPKSAAKTEIKTTTRRRLGW